jgi:translocation and assembly module TamB
MRWLNRLGLVLLAIGTLAIGCAALVLWLLGSESGTAWVFDRALARVSPIVTVGRTSGTLLGGFVLEDVRLRLTRDELDIERLALAWNANAALLGTLAFEAVEAGAVAYRRLPPPAVLPPPALAPFLPFVLRVDGARVASLSITVGSGSLVLGATRADASYFGRQLTIRNAVSSTASGLALSGSGDIGLDAIVAIAADVTWSGRAFDTDGAGRATVEGDWPVLRIHNDLTAPFPATVDGELRFEDAPRFDLDFAWQNLFIPGLALLTSPAGELSAAGTLDDYRFTGSGTLDIGGRSARFSGGGTANLGELAFEAFALDAEVDGRAAGTLRATGRLSLADRGAALAVQAQSFEPSWVHRAWPGSLTGTTALTTRFAPEFFARFDALALRGTLHGRPVTIGGAARAAAGNTWQLEPLELRSGANELRLSGTLDAATLALEADATLMDLQSLLADAMGQVVGKVSLAGTWQEPHASGSVEGSAISYGDYAVDSLRVAGEAGLASGTRLMLDVEAAGVRRGSLEASAARIALGGTPSALQATLDVQTEGWQVAAAASGSVVDLTWRGSIDSVEIVEQRLGDWMLESPAAASAGRAGYTLDTSCLMHESGARWCAALSLQGAASDRFVFSAQNFDVKMLGPLLPPQLTIDGVYQLSASFSNLAAEPRGAAVITGGTTRTRVLFGQQQAFATDLEDFRAIATLDGGVLDLAASVASTSDGSVRVNARIDDVRARDSTIGGSIDVQWPDLGFLALLSPDLGQVAGTLSGSLAIAGTVDEPTVDGRALWSEGRVSVPEWGLVVEGIEATATSADGRALAFDARGRVGEGQLSLTGTTALDPARGWPTRLALKGADLLAVQLPDAQVYVSPDLGIDVALPDIRVTGIVRLPRAAIEISALPAQAVAPSPDAVVHGEVADEVSRPLRLTANIELALGDDVRYTGLNLETKVSGGMRLDAEAGRSPTASGTLTLAGVYNAYGQKLDLERGNLLFTGPLDNPGLDVRAVRAIEPTAASGEQTRVGVELAGMLKSPRTRIFSTPAMSEADALSYLLLGRPLNGTGSEETATLQTAAITMGLQQALPAVQRIGESLGLDEFSVQTTDTDAGALMAGKYLSPKLYIRYSYGLFNRIGGLLLRFKVNERLSIETRSGDQKSMDLLYTVEKD